MKTIFFNKYIFTGFILFVLGGFSRVQAQYLTTIANLSLEQGFTGDYGPAVNAKFNGPRGITIDPAGNIYVADASNNRIRKIDLFGDVTTIAGTGKAGFSGDGGLAINAELNYPTYIILDDIGNLYITDSYNYRVRKIDTSGKITTIAGNGNSKHVFTGDGGPATDAGFDFPPYGLTFDSVGNLYIATSIRVRMVNTAGIMSSVVGNGQNGYGGDGGLALNASDAQITCVAFDKQGNLYLNDEYYHVIRKVDAKTGIINRFAGSEYIDPHSTYTGDGGPALSAKMLSPVDIKFDAAGNLFITDQDDGRIRKVDTAGIITTFAGNGTDLHSGDGDNAPQAGLHAPYGLVLDNSGNFFFTETSHNNTEMSNDVRFVFGSTVASAALPIVLYPNPTFDGVFRVLFSSEYEEDVDVEIVNQAGQPVYKEKAQTNRYVAIGIEPTGVYCLYGKSAHGQWKTKVSVVH